MTIICRLAALAFMPLAAAAPAPSLAAAEDLGLKVSYNPVRAEYCIRPHRIDATLTTGVQLYRMTCRTQERWAREGVRIERRHGDPARR